MQQNIPPPMDGEITLVFTDIQGSTKLWEAHGAAFQVALDLHNQVIRTSIERHMGYEVKTEALYGGVSPISMPFSSVWTHNNSFI